MEKKWIMEIDDFYIWGKLFFEYFVLYNCLIFFVDWEVWDDIIVYRNCGSWFKNLIFYFWFVISCVECVILRNNDGE